MVKLNLNFVDFKEEYKAIKKIKGVWGHSPRNFTTNFLKFVKFLLNHHRNIVIVIISQQGRSQDFVFGGQNGSLGGQVLKFLKF